MKGKRSKRDRSPVSPPGKPFGHNHYARGLRPSPRGPPISIPEHTIRSFGPWPFPRFADDLLNGVFLTFPSFSCQSAKTPRLSFPPGESRSLGGFPSIFRKVGKIHEEKIKMNSPTIRIRQPGHMARTCSRSLKKRTPTARVTGISICLTAST